MVRLSPVLAPVLAVLALPLAAGLLACSSGAAGNELSPSTVAAAPNRPVIGKLQTHDRSVILMASRDGLRVTVEDASGAAIARDVDVEGLRRIDPLAYELCRSSLAMTSVGGGPYLDASR
jgi:hypothetical protein